MEGGKSGRERSQGSLGKRWLIGERSAFFSILFRFVHDIAFAQRPLFSWQYFPVAWYICTAISQTRDKLDVQPQAIAAFNWTLSNPCTIRKWRALCQRMCTNSIRRGTWQSGRRMEKRAGSCSRAAPRRYWGTTKKGAWGERRRRCNRRSVFCNANQMFTFGQCCFV